MIRKIVIEEYEEGGYDSQDMVNKIKLTRSTDEGTWMDCTLMFFDCLRGLGYGVPDSDSISDAMSDLHDSVCRNIYTKKFDEEDDDCSCDCCDGCSCEEECNDEEIEEESNKGS